MSEEQQISKRKRKAKESWSKSGKKKKIDNDLDEDVPINPLDGNKKLSASKPIQVEDQGIGKDIEEHGQDKDEKKGDSDGKKKRFILFMGNLSYKTTKEDILTHIKPTGVQPLSVRLQSDAKTGKPKGFAFIDLPNFQALDKILNLHHSSLSGRKINIELTAGGGGKGQNRTAKIAGKNAKLDEEREAAQKTKREVESQKKSRRPAKADRPDDAAQADLENVDPSRRKRIAK